MIQRPTAREDYYHHRVNQVFRFLIPAGQRILYYGRYKKDIIPSLEGSQILIVSQREYPNEEIENAGQKRHFIHSRYEAFNTDEKFDYIILNGALGETSDICRVLKNIKQMSNPSARIIIYQHNFLWYWIIRLAGIVGIKKRGDVQNWLSIRDLKSCLNGMGFQTIRTFRRTICPFKLVFVGPLLNKLSALIPVFDFFQLDQFLIARPVEKLSVSEKPLKSLTILLTVRNEKGNIQAIAESLPQLTAEQEILFVEGHSTDGTREEIERVIKLYPQKNIRVIGQPGRGQGDAIHVGFREAKGDILILYEGDGTSSAGDIEHFYNTMKTGRFEFIEGSRFIYPLSQKSMPFLKQVGNTFFARWFSWFLGQHTTDVLSGIKAIAKKDYNIIDKHWGFLKLEDPFGDFELLYGAFRFGLKFCEIPMHYQPRPYGESKTRVFGHGLYLVRMAAKGYWVFRSAYTQGGYNQ